MSFNIKLRHLENENLHLLYGEPLIFHCNHFNLFLQRTIEDAGDYIPSEKILTDGATSVVWQMFQRLFEVNQHIREPKDRLKVASKIYSYLGFGLLDGLQTIAEKGGSFQTPITHYTYGWVNKWGKRTKPVDYFTCGYIQAAMAIAYYKKPSYYQVEQTQCLTMGHSVNEFSIRYSQDSSICPISPGRGVYYQRLPK